MKASFRSRPIYIVMMALAAFNLGRYSEHFSSSGWAWLALACNVFILCWVLFSIISTYRNDRAV
jgi:hypothetical protein